MTNSKQLDAWTGEFGDAYLDRNTDISEADLEPRTRALAEVISKCSPPPASILEVGSNIGRNLMALSRLCEAELHAVEPFTKAHQHLRANLGDRLASLTEATCQKLPFDDASFDFVFTSGVLIHISPRDLETAADEIHRVSSKYIWCNEYFAKSPEEINYRGQDGLLFKRDFGRFYLDRFDDLRPLATGFCWSGLSPFDDTVWWLFEKT